MTRYDSDASGPIAVSGWFSPRPITGCPTLAVARDPALALEFGVAADATTFCDPGAAHEVVTAAPTASRIWYRRVLSSDPAFDPPRWVAIDDATGEVIASGLVGR